MANPVADKTKPMTAHVDHTGHPYAGALTVDATPVATLLVDLPKGAMRGMLREKKDLDKVRTELAAAMPVAGAAAGISPDAYKTFLQHDVDVTKLAQLVPLLVKLAEVATESLAVLENAREQALGQIVDAVKSTAKRKKSNAVEGPFQKTLAYANQAAVKGAVTREKNVAAKAAKKTPGG